MLTLRITSGDKNGTEMNFCTGGQVRRWISIQQASAKSFTFVVTNQDGSVMDMSNFSNGSVGETNER